MRPDDTDSERRWMWVGAVMLAINLGIVIFVAWAIVSDSFGRGAEQSVAAEEQATAPAL